MSLDDDDIEAVFDEFRSMSKAKQKTIARSRSSLLGWLYDAAVRVGQFIGEVVSAPFKAIFSFFEGLLRGFF